ncbi:MAG TPA: transposase [Ktedonobacterales bacterium]|nr:transposase [Ktedonobacterales bacterium]
MWYAGLDWADRHHDVVVIDETGSQIASRRVEHTKVGLETLIRLSRGHQWPHPERATRLHHRDESWLADYRLAGSWVPGLSRQPEEH